MSSVKVFSTEPCRHCSAAKALLAARGVPFEEVNLTKDPDGRAQLAQRTGMQTFPQVVVGDDLVGGFRELVAADRAGRLAELLGLAA